MSFSSSAKAQEAASKLAEEQLYAQAADEVASGQIRQGLWAKALAETDGNEAAAKARYLKLRVETMKAEADVRDYAYEQAQKSAKKAQQEQLTPEERQAEIWGRILLFTVIGMPIIFVLSLLTR